MNRKNVNRLAFVLVIVCFLMSTLISLFTIGMVAKRNVEELNKTLAARIYDTISSELSEPTIVARTMASDHFVIEFLANEHSYDQKEAAQVMSEYLSEIKDAMNYETAFLVSDTSKRYYSHAGLNKQLAPGSSERDQWYVHFVDGGRKYDLDVDRNEVEQDHWTVFVDARIENEDGVLLGVCGVGAHMDECRTLFGELEKEYGVSLNLIDEDALIQVCSDESKIETEYPVNFALSNDDDYTFQKISGNRYVVTKYVDRLGWHLIVENDGTGIKQQLINAIILNVVVYLLLIIITFIAIRIIIARTKSLEKDSLTDQPTGLKNRRAFEERKTELAASAPDVNLVFVTADLNGLKAANDTLGHEAGDELIAGAAGCLKECFGKYGEVFRIGGDEFAAILLVGEYELREALDLLEKRTAAWKGKQVKELSIACGYASSREFPSVNIAELSKISDERMYAEKEKYYKRTGKDRRRPT